MSNSLALDGKVVLVTGAASGIGKAISERFAASGADLFEIDKGFQTSQSPEGKAKSQFQGDVTSSKNVQEAIRALKARFGRLDVLVNCAGIEMPGNVVDLPEESFQKVMDTNVKSIFLMCKYAIPLILQSTNKGSIINMSSDLGIQPIPNTDAYATTKGAIISLSKAMSKNWAKQGLRVNCIAPGPIDTPLLHRFHNEETLNFVANTLIPSGRVGKPEEVANVALFLASDSASYVNGAVLTVNGGLLG